MNPNYLPFETQVHTYIDISNCIRLNQLFNHTHTHMHTCTQAGDKVYKS